MSRFLKLAVFAGALAALPAATLGTAQAQDADAGEKVFRKCKACHAVGEGAGNKVGPHLNDLFGRTAGAIGDFKYSNAMKAAGDGGLVWNDESIATYLINPKDIVKGTKMAFAGLKKDEDRADVIAYLKTFSTGGGEEAPATQESKAEEPETKTEMAAAAPAVMAKDVAVPEHGVFHLGREALNEEIAAWDIDIRPDGTGLPVGKGTVAQGEPIYADNCAVCHGDFGEGTGRWPVLAGGHDTLTEERPEKTIGSYWPYLSTVYDYVRRAMPFGNARSLSDDDVYALTAYLLYLNDVVTDEDFELSNENFTDIHLPNEENFFMDDRASEPHYAEKSEPCMKDCIPAAPKVTGRARVLDVTPEKGKGPTVD